MYLSEPLKTLWKAHCTTELQNSPSWQPTWIALKEVMLNALGTPSERKQQAYETLKRTHQKPGQSPTDLLDYLRPLWEELGTSQTTELQVLEYISTLREDIQKDLFLLPVDRRSTLPLVEEHANVIYRRKGGGREHRESTSKKDSSRAEGRTAESEGTSKPRKKYKKAITGHNGPSSHKRGNAKDNDSEKVCFGCGEPGHIKPNCPNPKKDKDYSPNPKEGKGKGRKT